MKTIRTTVDDRTYNALRRIAAEQGVSVEALASDLFSTAIKKAQEHRLRAGIRAFSASDLLSRDDLHDRSRS